MKHIEIKTPEEDRGEVYTKFDWWQASLELGNEWGYLDRETGEYLTPENHLINWLKEELIFCDVFHGSGNHGFKWSSTFKRGDKMIAQVMHGGSNPNPNIKTSGQYSEEVRNIVVSKFPNGKISRVDSAYDSYSGTQEFKKIVAWAEERAKQLRINCRWIINSDDSIGNTLYIGSKTSRVQVRIYEKGKQMKYKSGEWWRAEVQLRPDTRSKGSSYNLSAGSVWGASQFTRELYSQMGGIRLAASGFRMPSEYKDLDTRASYMVTQYGQVLRDLVADEGGSVLAVIARLDRIAESLGKDRISQPEQGEKG